MKRFWLLAAVVACGTSEGTNDASAPDATLDAIAETGTNDAASDVTPDVPLTGCAARTTSDTTGIFVSVASGNDTTGCGTRAIPCKSVSQGITEATTQSGKTTVFVASGAYIESITLPAALTVEGGWAASGLTWTPICDNTTSSAVTIRGTTSATVTAQYIGASTLRDVTIESTTSPTANESVYGIFATGASTDLTLDHVVVVLGSGGAGADGTAGSAGTGGGDGGCLASNGTNGSSGSNGAGADSGSFGSAGYIGTSGDDGGVGQTGHNGSAGGSGSCATCQTFAGSCPNSCTFGSKQVCAGQGLSGCGGAGGSGGGSGGGGGASIALFVWDAHVTAFGGSFTAGNGGNGGGGGAGADGGPGSSGAQGSSASCATQLSNPQCLVNFCTGTLVSSTTLSGGSAGGTGGAGGVGGQGGGGSGGWSYAVVAGGDAGVTVDGGVLAHGDGGTGGTVGGANGSAGDRWP